MEKIVSRACGRCKGNKIFVWIIAYSIIFTGISAVLNNLSPVQAVLVLFYQIFIYAVPGLAAVLLLGIKVRTDVEWIGYSFVAGYCCNVVLYYGIVPFGLQRYIKVIGIVVAILGIGIIYLKRKSLFGTEDKSGMKICSIGVLCYALFMFVSYNGNGLTPNLGGGGY